MRACASYARGARRGRFRDHRRAIERRAVDVVGVAGQATEAAKAAKEAGLDSPEIPDEHAQLREQVGRAA